MKQQTVYVCDYCNRTFSDNAEAEIHEASECRLSVEDYRKWRTLNYACSEAGKRVSICKNSKTDAAFDEAIERLCEFEKQHNLENIKKPSNWI